MRKKITRGLILFISILGLFYFPFLNYLDSYEEGIARDIVSGDLSLQKKGWNMTPPWVLVSRIDVRPMRVGVTTSGRGFNYMLVEFVPAGYREFVETEGFYYYWWANRLSFNLGYDEEYRGMRDLLRGYAYSVKKYQFVRIVRTFEEGE